MGVDYVAYTIIGIRIPRDRIITETKERGCSCAVPVTSTYCPDCGNLAYITTYPPIDLYVPCETFAGFNIVDDPDNDEIYVGEFYKVDEDNYEESLEFEAIERLKSSLKTKLTPHGFWDENEFKIWSVFSVS